MSATNPLDRPTLINRLAELAHRLGNSSSDAKDLLQPITQQLQGHAAQPGFLQVAQLVNDYALDEALVALRAWEVQWAPQWGKT